MNADIFKDIIVPVIGGLGLFLLGLEFMDKGIQALSVNRMRELLGKMAGTPAKGVVAGTVITGIIQSSTAMTVMTVGLVNAGVLSLRSSIGVIMGANIGTTLGNGLIALPLGPVGLLFGGIFATMYCFARSDKLRNISLAAMGFALVFYGLNLMTGGLKPLKGLPQVMSVISNLDASSILGVVSCALIAAAITALIHSSSATIGIVMGLGASGVLDWQTAIAFAIGADLGTTVTSWIASLNLSKNAKRTAYAHITFNLIGVCVVLALFFPAIRLLEWGMGFFGGNPGTPVVVDGHETFPLVPVAVGMFSIVFNIFNVLILFPFVNRFEQVLSRIVKSDPDEPEDYSVPRFLDRDAKGDLSRAIPAVQRENHRILTASGVFLDVARGKGPTVDPGDHFEAVDSLSREVRGYAAGLLRDDLTRDQLDLVASLIEETDFTDSLAENLYQIARRADQDGFTSAGRRYLDEGLRRLDQALDGILEPQATVPATPAELTRESELEQLRWRVIDATDIKAMEKGAILSLLGSVERAEVIVNRIHAERASVDRDLARRQRTPSAAAADPAPAVPE